jgi:hypothetical protein
MPASPKTPQPQLSTTEANTPPPPAKKLNSCPTCHEWFEYKLKYHTRIKHQASTVAPYPKGSEVLYRHEDGTFHCLYCPVTHTDPNNIKVCPNH